MNYIDGFVAAVPNENKQAYLKMATEMADLFKEHGALSVVECWGDDVPEGKLTSFTMAVKRESHENTVFSWITWPSKQARDDAWEKLMKDPRMKPPEQPLFDGKRMIFGGFTVLMSK